MLSVNTSPLFAYSLLKDPKYCFCRVFRTWQVRSRWWVGERSVFFFGLGAGHPTCAPHIAHLGPCCCPVRRDKKCRENQWLWERVCRKGPEQEHRARGGIDTVVTKAPNQTSPSLWDGPREVKEGSRQRKPKSRKAEDGEPRGLAKSSGRPWEILRVGEAETRNEGESPEVGINTKSRGRCAGFRNSSFAFCALVPWPMGLLHKPQD